MSKTDKKRNDAQIIERRTAAWNKRPVMSMEMYAKTNWEKKLTNKVKSVHTKGMKTYYGKRQQKNLQDTIMFKDFSKSPLMQSATVTINKIKF
jgi:hypothetical protein